MDNCCHFYLFQFFVLLLSTLSYHSLISDLEMHLLGLGANILGVYTLSVYAQATDFGSGSDGLPHVHLTKLTFYFGAVL